MSIMADRHDSILRLVTTPDDSSRRCGAALADVFKALKATSFYPKGHPLRAENLQHAHQLLVTLLNGKELLLVINRTGFSATDGGAKVDNNPMAQAFARELFIRRVQRLMFLADLSFNDLQAFLLLLTIDPQKIVAAGGIESLMAKQGIKTIWTNEIDLPGIQEKLRALEGDTHDSLEDVLTEEAPPLPEETDRSIDELLVLLDKERDDNRYLQLARTLADKAESFKTDGAFATLLPVMVFLLGQNSDQERSAIQREYSLFTLEQIAGGKMTDFLIQQLEERGNADNESIYRVFMLLGGKIAYVLIQRLCIADGLLARKALATALVKIGSPALPALVSMLRDERWYVVRNMVGILGELRCQECVTDLKTTANHTDHRVRKETIRALMNVGGQEAEAVIIRLMADKDTSIVRQAVLSLGIMKSQQAIQPLLEIVEGRDLFLKSITLKIEALQALGRIGTRRATPHLLGLLTRSHWLAWKKDEQLKIAAATTLGQIGDEAALPALKARAERGGSLGMACAEAIDNIERLAGEIYV
jgi:HEAT repeat protein